jgi:hypothetical protein
MLLIGAEKVTQKGTFLYLSAGLALVIFKDFQIDLLSTVIILLNL